MIPSCFPWKVVIFFGKEHVNRSSISGIMIGLSWEIKFGKINYLFGNTNFEFSKLDFPTSSYHNFINTKPMDMIFTKNVTTFHGQQDGIIYFCLSPIKSGVLSLWIHIFIKIFSKLDCSTSFKLPKHPYYWDWDKYGWFHLVSCEK